MNNSTKQAESIATLRQLLRYKWFIIIFSLIVTGISVYIAFGVLKPWYKSTVNLVPSNNGASGSESAVAGISSALKDFGLTRLGGKMGGESYSFMVILTSRSVIDSMIKKYDLLERYEIEGANMAECRDAFLGNLLIDFDKEGNYQISIWDTDKKLSAEMANDFPTIANAKALDIFKKETQVNLGFLEARIALLDSTLNIISDSLAKFSNANLIFSIEDQAKAAADGYSDLKAAEIQAGIQYSLAKSKYGENDPATISAKNSEEEIGRKLRDFVSKPGFAGNFAVSNASDVGLHYIKLYAEFETYTKVKAFLFPLVEQARMNMIKNFQTLIVVDEAVTPLKKDRPKRSLVVGGAALGGFILSVLIVLSLTSLGNIRRRLKEE